MSVLFVFIFLMYFTAFKAEIKENYEGYCMDAKHHKAKPGMENVLYNHCSPWRNRSCCSQNTTEKLHSLALYPLNFEHCGKLSESCKNHFIRDSCFYECSPNVGPWIVNITQPSENRKQRFYQVPLCQSECNAWFQDCKDGKTCFKNWANELKNNANCSKECVTIEEMYKNATSFCEQIWNNSWLVTLDDKPCMKLWFNETDGNPNEKVAAEKLKKITFSTIEPTENNGADIYFSFPLIGYSVVGTIAKILLF